MIKNIIFDLGNVLIGYKPEKFISEFVSEKNRKNFFERVFKNSEWLDLDRGTLEYDEAMDIFIADLPEEKESIKNLFENDIQGVLFPIKKNLELLPQLKARGYRLYILSNFHRRAFMKISEKCSFDKYFDGKVISCEVHFLKPEKEIYEEIIKKYDLDVKETLFIDDTLVNIEEAKQFGISTIHLDDENRLKDELEKFLKINL